MKLLPTSLFSAACLLAVGLLSQPHSAQAQSGAQPDPQMKVVLDKLASLNPKPIETLTPEEARKQPSIADAAKHLMLDQGKKPQEVAKIDDRKIKFSDDRTLDVRVYSPDGNGPFPIILYIHGGGWVIATMDTYDATPRGLCASTGAVVVSVEYRKAPENKFPAAHLDCLGAYKWLQQYANEVKGDSSKIAIVGESAGGTMACAVSMMAKEAGLKLPVAQVLVYPVANLTNMNTPSYLENAEAKPLNKAMMEWFGKQTLAKPEDAANPRLSLLLAGDELKGLPPTTIITAEIDPLHSEGEALAKALKDAGVEVNYKHFSGVTHEFFGLAGLVDKATEAQAYAAGQLKLGFAK